MKLVFPGAVEFDAAACPLDLEAAATNGAAFTGCKVGGRGGRVTARWLGGLRPVAAQQSCQLVWKHAGLQRAKRTRGPARFAGQAAASIVGGHSQIAHRPQANIPLPQTVTIHYPEKLPDELLDWFKSTFEEHIARCALAA